MPIHVTKAVHPQGRVEEEKEQQRKDEGRVSLVVVTTNFWKYIQSCRVLKFLWVGFSYHDRLASIVGNSGRKIALLLPKELRAEKGDWILAEKSLHYSIPYKN